MASITITIPDAIAPRVVDAVCETHGYDANNIAHGTKIQFAKAQLINWLRNTTINHEAQVASISAREAAASDAASAIIDIM